MKIILSIVIITSFIFYMSSSFEFSRMMGRLNEINYIIVSLSFLGIVLGILLKSIRLSIILNNTKQLKKIILVQYIGILINSFIPFRAGEFFMLFEISKRIKKNKTSVFSCIIVDRLFEFCLVGILIILLIINFNLKISNINLIFYLTTFILIFFLFIILLIKFRNRFFNALIRFKKLTEHKFISKIALIFKDLISELSNLSKLKIIIKILVLSLFSTGFFVVSLYMITSIFVSDPSIIAVIFSYCLVILGIAITSSPGGVGVVHAAITYGLIFFNVNQTDALLIAVIYHLLNISHNLIFGIGSICFSDIKLDLNKFSNNIKYFKR